MDSHPGVLSRLKYFMSEDTRYYNSPRFRQVVIKNLYESEVRQRIARTIKMPLGLQGDAPELDNLTEETLAKVRRNLDANKIAECPEADLRFKKCTGFVMTLAYREGINFTRKNGFPWSHGEFSKEIVGHEPRWEHEQKSAQAELVAECAEVAKERDDKDRLRKALGQTVTETNFEIYWLARRKRLDRREIQARFPKLTTNHIGVKAHRVAIRAAEHLSNPVVIRHLLGGGNDEEK